MGFIVTVKKSHPTGLFRRGGVLFTINPTFLEKLPPEVKDEITSPTGWLVAERASRPPEEAVEESSTGASVEKDTPEGEEA